MKARTAKHLLVTGLAAVVSTPDISLAAEHAKRSPDATAAYMQATVAELGAKVASIALKEGIKPFRSGNEQVVQVDKEVTSSTGSPNGYNYGFDTFRRVGRSGKLSHHIGEIGISASSGPSVLPSNISIDLYHDPETGAWIDSIGYFNDGVWTTVQASTKPVPGQHKLTVKEVDATAAQASEVFYQYKANEPPVHFSKPAIPPGGVQVGY